MQMHTHVPFEANIYINKMCETWLHARLILISQSTQPYKKSEHIIGLRF